MSSIISIDTWATILSYFKDTDIESVKPNQFIAIMTMSFINKSLRNLITSNTFWILYNNNGYKSAKYNIYNCNLNFCHTFHKLRKIKSDENITEYHAPFNLNRNIFSVGLYCEKKTNGVTYRYDISNILETIAQSYTMASSHPQINYTLTENDYCILFQVSSFGENEITFYIKNNSLILYDHALKDFADFCELNNIHSIHNNLKKNIGNFKYFVNQPDFIQYPENDVVLYDNYIWSFAKRQKDVLQEESIEINKNNKNNIINFYAHNVMTNITYLIHQIEELDYEYLTCCFTDNLIKDYFK